MLKHRRQTAKFQFIEQTAAKEKLTFFQFYPRKLTFLLVYGTKKQVFMIKTCFFIVFSEIIHGSILNVGVSPLTPTFDKEPLKNLPFGKERFFAFFIFSVR